MKRIPMTSTGLNIEAENNNVRDEHGFLPAHN